jgi:hypothetical protein
MPRQVRIEFSGAMYHVMPRGDRREALVKDEEDRRTFVRTLGEAVERAGFRVHAWVLRSRPGGDRVQEVSGSIGRAVGRTNETPWYSIGGSEGSRGMAGPPDR